VQRSKLSNVLFCVTLVTLVLFPSILSTRAVFSYLPAVIPGEFAQYRTLKYSCQSALPQICQSFETSLNDTTYAAVQIVGVSGPSVTLQLISIYKNGTGGHVGGLVNVATGASNITAFSLGANDDYVLAGGLAAPDQIWNTLSAPTLNKTISEMVLGSVKSVNLLNSTLSGSYMGISYLQSFDFAFDQSSGFLIEIKSSVRTNVAGILELDFAIGMVDNNVWGSAHLPDFDLSADPTSLSVAANASGNSTITLHRLYGFSATVSLSIASASGVSCSLSANSLAMGSPDTSTLSCNVSPGTHTIVVEGNGGYSVHNASITVAVSATPLFAQLISILSMPLVYDGVGVAAVVAVLASFLFLRRKPRAAVVAPGDASTRDQTVDSHLSES
jgi:hypothetical protein